MAALQDVVVNGKCSKSPQALRGIDSAHGLPPALIPFESEFFKVLDELSAVPVNIHGANRAYPKYTRIESMARIGEKEHGTPPGISFRPCCNFLNACRFRTFLAGSKCRQAKWHNRDSQKPGACFEPSSLLQRLDSRYPKGDQCQRHCEQERPGWLKLRNQRPPQIAEKKRGKRHAQNAA